MNREAWCAAVHGDESTNDRQANHSWELLLHYSQVTFLDILHTLDFSVSSLPFHSEQPADFINMLPITFSRWLMGLKTGPNSNQCFYSGPFCRVICFMVKVSFHYFFVVFGNPFSPSRGYHHPEIYTDHSLAFSP